MLVNIEEIKTRNTVFTYDQHPQWNMNIHLIKGKNYNFLIDTAFGTGSMKPVLTYATVRP